MLKITGTTLVLAITVLLVLYFSATAVGNLIENRKLDGERTGLEREIAAYQRQHQQLLGLQDYLRSDEYIQMVARRELGLVMPGEPSVVIISPESVAGWRDGDRWWRHLVGP